MGKSSSLEDYLKCILVLQKKNDSVRSIDIAKEMGVTKPSVCIAMKKLRKQAGQVLKRHIVTVRGSLYRSNFWQ